jgi:hypothetical protein
MPVVGVEQAIFEELLPAGLALLAFVPGGFGRVPSGPIVPAPLTSWTGQAMSLSTV